MIELLIIIPDGLFYSILVSILMICNRSFNSYDVFLLISEANRSSKYRIFSFKPGKETREFIWDPHWCEITVRVACQSFLVGTVFPDDE